MNLLCEGNARDAWTSLVTPHPAGVQRLFLAVNLSAVAAPRLAWPVFLDYLLLPRVGCGVFVGFTIVFSLLLLLMCGRLLSPLWYFGFLSIIFLLCSGGGFF